MNFPLLECFVIGLNQQRNILGFRRLPLAIRFHIKSHGCGTGTIPEGLRKVELVQLFPSRYGTATIMVAAADGTGRSGFHLT